MTTTIKNIPSVQNMLSDRSGKGVKNQFEMVNVTIKHKGKNYTGRIFQSYSTTIAFQSRELTLLDSDKWDYSATTGKYRNQFLRMNIAETREAIKSGEIQLAKLN